MNAPDTVTILGIPVHAVTMTATLELVERFMAKPRVHQLATVNPEFVMAAQSDAAFRRILQSADLCPVSYTHLDVYKRQLMVGMEFVKDRDTKEPGVALRDHVIQTAFENGLLLIPCGTNSLRITPPLNIDRALVEEGLVIFERALTDAEATHLKNGA